MKTTKKITQALIWIKNFPNAQIEVVEQPQQKSLCMKRFHDKPWLLYLIEQLKEIGVTSFLFIGEHLFEIRDFFKDGKAFQVEIQYHISTNSDWKQEIKTMQQGIHDVFWLLDASIYSPMPLQKILDRWNEEKIAFQSVLFDYTFERESNISKEPSHRSYLIDNMSSKDSQDIGYSLCRKSFVAHDKAESHHNTDKISTFISAYRYYSVLDFQQHEDIEQLFSNQKTIFLDRDGVLSQRPPTGFYIKNWNEWYWIPNSLEAISKLTKQGFRLILITNQAGVSRGRMSLQDVYNVHEFMLADILSSGGNLHRIYFCPHYNEDGCRCRKPDIGMFLQASYDFNIDLTKTIFIGDDIRDQWAATNVGCGFYRISETTSLFEITQQYLIPTT